MSIKPIHNKEKQLNTTAEKEDVTTPGTSGAWLALGLVLGLGLLRRGQVGDR